MSFYFLNNELSVERFGARDLADEYGELCFISKLQAIVVETFLVLKA